MKPRTGESPEAFAARLAEIEEIVSGFRWGRYRGEEAERLEVRLAELRVEDPPH